MRLFIAVPFDGRATGRLVDEMLRLKNFAHSGNFTRRENLHLTIEFLGEVEKKRLPEVKSALKAAADGVPALSMA